MDNKNNHNVWIERACELAEKSVDNGTGPFGAVIVDRNTDTLISEAHNTVTQTHDPTAHAEINAIRKACEIENTHILDKHILYTSSYPCPMCLSAIYWARIPTVIYANPIEVASKHSFDDSEIQTQLQLLDKEKSIHIKHHPFPHSENAFHQWDKKIDKIFY